MRFSLHRPAAISLALATMLLRALLPDGWMPSAETTPLTICSVNVDRHDVRSSTNREHGHAPCAFAAAAPLAPPTIATLGFGVSREASRAAPPFASDPAEPEPLYQPNAARAPPAFA